jgi:16S rRNA processing protein RimM
LRIAIGFVLRAHGIKGLVRVRAGDSILSLGHVYVAGERMRVLRAQREKDEFLVELQGVADRDAAEMLKGAELSADREELPALGANEVYLSDLVGFHVFDVAGADLGEVIAVESGAQDRLTIRGATTWDLPYPLVVSVDVAERKIVCDPPEGLADL